MVLATLVVGTVLGRAATSSSREPPELAPELEFVAPAELSPYAQRLERIDRQRVAAVMRLVGLVDPGRPIRILLVPEDSPLARQTPSWVAGYTRGRGDVIVLLPTRAPSYPHDSLEALLQHEVAHVLIRRAAGNRSVPRWFHEGLALTAERMWGFGDRARFVYEVARRGPVPIEALDDLFDGSRRSVILAYSLSGAFMEDLLVAHGSGWPARVLEQVAQGRRFDEAFRVVAGAGVAEASDAFWRRHRFVGVWLPWVTSPSTLWSVITLLAIAAILQLRRRRAARRRQWEAEEGPDSPSDPPYTVH